MTQLQGLLPNPPPLKPSVPHPEIGSQARSSLLYSCSSRRILACYVQQRKMLMFQKYPSVKWSHIESAQHNGHGDAVRAQMRFGCWKKWNICAHNDSVMMFRRDRHKLVQHAEDWQQENQTKQNPCMTHLQVRVTRGLKPTLTLTWCDF